MAKNRIVLSDTELLSYSALHLHYEIAMCIVGSALLSFGFKFESQMPALDTEEVQKVVRFAMLEAFAVHLRNLIDFFYPARVPTDSDVIADDFFPNGVRPNNFPQLSNSLKDARKRAHKQVAHLTNERLPDRDSGKQWKFVELRNDIGSVLRLFVDAASPDKLHPSVPELVRMVTPRRAGAF